MDSVYLIWFHARDLILPKGTKPIVSVAVSSRTFLPVEDWAFSNTPEGYDLRSIEKHYGSEHELTQMFGKPELVLDSDNYSMRVMSSEDFDALIREGSK